VVQPAVTEDGKKAPGLKFGNLEVMAPAVGAHDFSSPHRCFRNHDLRQQVADLLGDDAGRVHAHQMTYDLRRLRLKGLIYRPRKPNRYFVTPFGWKVAGYPRLEARVFRPAMAMLPPMTPFFRSRYVKPSIASTRSLIC